MPTDTEQSEVINMRNSAGKSSQYLFSQVPNMYLPRTKMWRPSQHKTTITTDYLYPLFWDEVLPGDTFKLDVSVVAKFTTLLVPIMDNLYLDWQFYFVPYRLLWEHWVNMHGERSNPADSIDYTTPYLTPPSGGIAAGSIGDYMGLPLGVEWDNGDVSALPFRAYNLIYNEWYRDENLIDSLTVSLGDSAESISNFTLQKRGKRKDYFTSALPSPQKGPAVTIPLGDLAPVKGNGMVVGLTNGTSNVGLNNNSASFTYSPGNYGQPISTTRGTDGNLNGKWGITTDPAKSGMVADLSAVEGVGINALRQAFQLQKLLERDSRSGTRYFETLAAHFNCVSPDARLQRPEFLGSFSVPIQVNTVVQNSATASGGTPQGNLSAFATANGVFRAFTKSFVEYGCIIGLASVRADLCYQQGIPRAFSRRGRYDYLYPEFYHLGEQAILNKEIFAQGPTVVDNLGNKIDDKAFGYQERWSEYKYGFNRISGYLRSAASGSLDCWHLAQDFANLPTLNQTFIEEAVPLDRVTAVSGADAPPIILDCFFDLNCVRPLPMYDVPGLIDHF